MTRSSERHLEYGDMQEQTGMTIVYEPLLDGGIVILVRSSAQPTLEVSFGAERVDEAHILYAEVTELLDARAGIGQDPVMIYAAVVQLFALYHGEKAPETPLVVHAPKQSVGEYIPNPGKHIEIDVDGITYLRLPIKTEIITMRDTSILPLIEVYVKPHLQAGDTLFISEKALTITQGRVVDMSNIKPSKLAHFLARRVGNYYGTANFRGFGHGTAIAMQAFIEEAGTPRVLFAAAISALTRPLGIRGLFYRLCGLRAKSIDCPMSFLILEYAHAVKLAPNDPSLAAKQIKTLLGGVETVILDANYRGAFSLGKSTRSISEAFIGTLFRDNPLGQSDEMTPFCIVRKA